MAQWNYDASQYKENDFQVIPVGDYRVRIDDVVEKVFRSGNEGYEITLRVNGFASKLWFYLVLDPSAPDRTNQRIGEFFDCFGITNHAMGSGKQWIGMAGAVRVKHDEYNGNVSAKVGYCIKRSNQDKLPAWKDGGATSDFVADTSTDELPFDM